MRSTILRLAGVLLAAALPAPALAQEPAGAAPAATASDPSGVWITLGTRAGPIPAAGRSQPANLLRFGGKLFLVDAGDGTAGQLARVGIAPGQLDGVFISHLHFDHTGGLAAILGLRYQTTATRPLLIYGPPGTREMVDGLIASMMPGATAGYGVAGAPFEDPRDDVQVLELRDRAHETIDGMAVSVRNNTHYTFAAGSPNAGRFESLSFRFDLPGRSIVYTGDTGPSREVEELAKGADLLIAEMMDVDALIGLVRTNNRNMPEAGLRNMETHLRTHHLTPRDVGEMAARAKAKAVVVTHFAGAEAGDPRHFGYLRTIGQFYSGAVTIANDMDAF